MGGGIEREAVLGRAVLGGMTVSQLNKESNIPVSPPSLCAYWWCQTSLLSAL